MIDPDNNYIELAAWSSLSKKKKNTTLLLVAVLILFLGILLGYNLGTATIINYYADNDICQTVYNITRTILPTTFSFN